MKVMALVGTYGRADVDAVVAAIVPADDPLRAGLQQQRALVNMARVYGIGLVPSISLVKRVKRLFPHMSLRESMEMAAAIESIAE